MSFTHGPYGKHAVAAAATWEKVTATDTPSTSIRTVTVTWWNPAASAPANAVRIAVSSSGTGTDITDVECKIEPGQPLLAKQQRILAGVILGPGQNVWVYSDLTGVCVDVTGVEGNNS